jgi:hypothetical protein
MKEEFSRKLMPREKEKKWSVESFRRCKEKCNKSYVDQRNKPRQKEGYKKTSRES